MGRAPLAIRAAALLLLVSAGGAPHPAWADRQGKTAEKALSEGGGGGGGAGGGEVEGVATQEASSAEDQPEAAKDTAKQQKDRTPSKPRSASNGQAAEAKTVAPEAMTAPTAAASAQAHAWEVFFETMSLGDSASDGRPPVYQDKVLGLPAVVHVNGATDAQLRAILASEPSEGRHAAPLLDRPVSHVKVAVDGAMTDAQWASVKAGVERLFAPADGAVGKASPMIERVPVNVEGIARHAIPGAIESVEKEPENARQRALALVATLGERSYAAARAMPGKLAAIPGHVLEAAKGAGQAIMHPKDWWADKSSGGAQRRNQAFGGVWGFGWTLVDVGLWLGVVGGGPGVIAFALSMGLNHVWSVWPNELNDAFAYGGWTRVLFGTKGGTRAYEANDLLMMHFGLGPAFKGDEAAAKNAIAAKLGMTAAELGDVFSISWRHVENSNPKLMVELNIGELRKRRSAARAAMEKQSREHREALAGVLAAGDGKWEAIQGAQSVVTDEDKKWAAWERAAAAFSDVEDQANKLGRAVASGTDASKGNPWQRIGSWIEGSALRKGQIAHLINGSAWMLVFLELSYLGGLSSFGALSLPALAIVATAVPASLICSSGFWGSQVMNRQHLLTSGGRWVFSLIGDTFFRINSKIAQTGSLWLWAAAIATEFGWAGYRYVTGLVGQREGPPHGVGQLLKGVGRVLKTEFTADERPIGENASGVVTLVHPSAVTAPDELVTNQLGQLDLRREQRPSAVTATGEKPVAIIALAGRDQAFKRAVADQLSRELRENALYNLGIEGVAGGKTPGRLSAGPQKAVDLVAQLEKGLSPEEQSVRDAWRRELTPKGNQRTWRASARDRFREAMAWVKSRRPAGIAPAMATATAH